jgi:hypothetical protein
MGSVDQYPCSWNPDTKPTDADDIGEFGYFGACYTVLGLANGSLLSRGMMWFEMPIDDWVNRQCHNFTSTNEGRVEDIRKCYCIQDLCNGKKIKLKGDSANLLCPLKFWTPLLSVFAAISFRVRPKGIIG